MVAASADGYASRGVLDADSQTARAFIALLSTQYSVLSTPRPRRRRPRTPPGRSGPRELLAGRGGAGGGPRPDPGGAAPAPAAGAPPRRRGRDRAVAAALPPAAPRLDAPDRGRRLRRAAAVGA